MKVLLESILLFLLFMCIFEALELFFKPWIILPAVLITGAVMHAKRMG